MAFAMAIASIAFTALGTIQQYQSAQAAAKYEEQVQKNNNIMAERARDDALRRGRREETLRRMQTTQDVAAATSRIAGSGFDVNTGSALTKQGDIRAMGDIEARTIRSNAAREAYGIQTSNLAERANSAGRVSSLKNQAKGSLISGASQIASSAYTFRKHGTF